MTLQVTLRHRRAGFTLDLAFTAPPGLTALFGRSGAGKTTVVDAIAGLLRPDAGRVVQDGTVLLDTERGIFVPPHRRRVGYVFQEPRLFPHLSVAGNLRYGARFAPGGSLAARVARSFGYGASAGRGSGDGARVAPVLGHGARVAPDLGHGARVARNTDRETFDRVVALLGLDALLDRRTAALSGGEKSRVAIGRALLADPRLLLLDEPLAALDDDRKAEILPYLERLRDHGGVPMVYVSHAATEIARLATTVVALEDGRVLRAGPAADVLADPAALRAGGVRSAGAVLRGRVTAHHADGLTEIALAGSNVFLPRLDAAPGSSMRVRIEAHDVILSRTRPEGLSALNILGGIVRAVRVGDGPAVLVQLDTGGGTLLARITRRSAETLGILPGVEAFAIVKTVSVARLDVGISGSHPDAPPDADAP